MIYNVIALPLFLLSLFSILDTKFTKYSKYIGSFFIFILITIATIRYKTGTDFDSYTSIWEGISSLSDGAAGREYLEPGFRYLLSFLKMFTDSPVLFFGVMATITLCFFYSGLKKIEDINIYVAIFFYFMIFYIPYAFNAMRQAVAMSIYIYSLSYILNKRFKAVFLLSILASSFHISGILILLSYMIIKIKFNLIYFFVLGTVISFLLYYTGFISSLIDLTFGNKFSLYVENYGRISTSQLYFRTVLAIFFVLLSSYVLRIDSYKKIVLMYLLGYFLYIILADAGMMATRFNMFFRVLEIILFSMVLHQSRYILNRVFIFIFLLSLTVTNFNKDITNKDNFYKTILYAG